MRKLLPILAVLLISCSSSKESSAAAKQANPQVVLDTNQGQIVLELYPDKAPTTVKNFLQYVDQGFYNGLIFHRVIPDFMIQGGGFRPDLTQAQPSAPIQNEANNGLRNERGTIAMARTSDPNSATSQFFINLKHNVSLDHRGMSPQGMGYAVFGKVVSGMGTVDGIAATTTKCPSQSRAPCTERLPPGMRDVPAEPIVINKAYRK